MLLLELIPDWAYHIYKNSNSDLKFNDFEFSAIVYEDRTKDIECKINKFEVVLVQNIIIKYISITFKEFLENYSLRYPDNNFCLDNKLIHVQLKNV